jgi:hypothetical protein
MAYQGECERSAVLFLSITLFLSSVFIYEYSPLQIINSNSKKQFLQRKKRNYALLGRIDNVVVRAGATAALLVRTLRLCQRILAANKQRKIEF